MTLGDFADTVASPEPLGSRSGLTNPDPPSRLRGQPKPAAIKSISKGVVMQVLVFLKCSRLISMDDHMPLHDALV